MKHSTSATSAAFLVLVSLFSLTGCGRAPAPVAEVPRAVEKPASPIKELPELEADVLKALNDVRKDPKSYIARLRSFLPKFDGKKLIMDESTIFNTNEGEPAVEEAIEALETQAARGVILNSPELRRASLDHLIDQITKGGEGHTGNDGSTPRQRMDRYAQMKESGEIINYNTYGGEVTGAAVLASFIIDDGVPDRGHRKGVFFAKFTHAGVACGHYPKWGPSCVIDMANDPKAK